MMVDNLIIKSSINIDNRFVYVINKFNSFLGLKKRFYHNILKNKKNYNDFKKLKEYGKI